MTKTGHARRHRNEDQGKTAWYTPVNTGILWREPNLIFREGGPGDEINLHTFFLPPTPAHPRTLNLAQDQRYLNTLLAVVDRVTTKSRQNAPSHQLVRLHVIFFRHFVDWCRSQAIYSLSDFDADAAGKLIREYSAGGWTGALRAEERWHDAIDRVSSERFDPNAAFYISKGAGGLAHLDSIRAPFWRERIGWGGGLTITRSIRERLEELAGMPPGKNWLVRRDAENAPPSEFSLRNALSHINDYCNLPDSVDRPLYRISQSPNLDARRFAGKRSERTPNLSIEDAASLIKSSIRALYQLAPPLLQLLSDARNKGGVASHAQSLEPGWLERQPILIQLQALSGRPIQRWVNSGAHGKNDLNWTVDQLIGIVQGACALVIAAMNARRSREVCDPRLGVRVGDLTVVDEELSIYRASFYIEKTYCARHQFYVNRTTADAFRCLESLKDVMAALVVDDETRGTGSLFACHRRGGDRPRGREEYHFSFCVDEGKARSLSTFLDFAYERNRAPEIRSHMFRRFFAILYYHQFDHPDLRALKQHLRHIDVAMTRTYVTDNAARPLGERIKRKIGNDRLSIVTNAMRSSLDGTYDDLQSIIESVGRDKFRSTIESILSGRQSSGGFTRIVRSMYRRLAMSATFARESAGMDIASRLEHGGYSIRVMQHGQCHSPEQTRSLRGKCEQAGLPAREHASPLLCNTCPFHYSDLRYLPNIREELAHLETDVSEQVLPGMMHERAKRDLINLRSLVNMLETQEARSIYSPDTESLTP